MYRGTSGRGRGLQAPGISRTLTYMNRITLTACLIVAFVSCGCQNVKWPWEKKQPTTQPAMTEPSPEEKAAELQQQVKTLEAKLTIVKAEKQELSDRCNTLQDRVNSLTFSQKMLDDQLKVLRMARVERDVYKSRAERLAKELAKLEAKLAGHRPGAASRPATAPSAP